MKKIWPSIIKYVLYCTPIQSFVQGFMVWSLVKLSKRFIFLLFHIRIKIFNVWYWPLLLTHLRFFEQVPGCDLIHFRSSTNTECGNSTAEALYFGMSKFSLYPFKKLIFSNEECLWGTKSCIICKVNNQACWK